MQHRHEKRIIKRDDVEPSLVELGSEHLLPGPTASWRILIFALAQTILCRVGVGFSYADFGETIETTEDAAKNVYAFISLFFEAFPQFGGRALHLSGESYGVCPTFPFGDLVVNDL